MLEFFNDFFFFWLLSMFLNLNFRPHKQKLKGVFNSNFIALRLTIHEKLSKMEEILTLSRILIDSAFLIHIHELFLCDFLVKIFIKLPDHPFNFCFGHLDFHLLQHLLDLILSKEFSIVWCRQVLKHFEKVFLFSGVDLKLL